MADRIGLPTINWREHLTDEEKKRLRRGRVADFLFGGDREDKREREYMPLAYGRMGEEAIREIEGKLSDPEREKVDYDLSGISRKFRSEMDDPEAMNRFERAPRLQEHIEELSRKKVSIPNYPELKMEHITRKGLGDLPNVKEYTEGKEQEQFQKSTGELSDMLKDKNPLVAKYINLMAQKNSVEGLREAMLQALKSMESKEKADRTQELETHKLGLAKKKLDYEYGLKGKLEKLKDKLKNDARTSNFSDEEKKDMYKFIERTDEDPTLEYVNKAFNASSSIRETVINRSKLAPSVIKSRMPRYMGEVGNLAKQEQLMWAGSQAWGDKFARFLKTGATGQMTDTDAKEILSLLDIFDRNLGEKAKGRIKMMSEQSSYVSGISKETLNGLSNSYISTIDKHLEEAKEKTYTGVKEEDEFDRLFNSED